MNAGSLMHPHRCRECQDFFFGAEGCLNGAACEFCHEDHSWCPRGHGHWLHDEAEEPCPSPPAAWDELSLDAEGLEERMLELEDRLRQLELEDLHVAVTLADPSARGCPIIDVSAGFAELTGYELEDVSHRSWLSLNQGSKVSRAQQQGLLRAEDGGKFVGLVQSRKKSGELFMNFVHMATVQLSGHAPYVIGVHADFARASHLTSAQHKEEFDLTVAWLLDQSEQARMSRPYGSFSFEEMKLANTQANARTPVQMYS